MDESSEPIMCEGLCNFDYRRSRIDADGDHISARGEVLKPSLGQPIWCDDCAARIRSDLVRIPTLAASCVVRRDGRLLTGSDAGDTTRHGTRAGSPSASPAFDLVDELAAWLQQTVRELDATTHTQTQMNGTLWRGEHLNRNVRYLIARLPVVLADSAMGGNFGRCVGAWVKRLERASGMDVLVHRLPAPCPTCDSKALTRTDGSEHITCTRCGRQWVESDYQRLISILADEAKRERAS